MYPNSLNSLGAPLKPTPTPFHPRPPLTHHPQVCTNTNRCFCEFGFTGPDCSIPVPTTIAPPTELTPTTEKESIKMEKKETPYGRPDFTRANFLFFPKLNLLYCCAFGGPNEMRAVRLIRSFYLITIIYPQSIDECQFSGNTENRPLD